MAAIRVTDLVKRYRTAAALDGVSFSIEGGGPVALVGKNGAGKTTLLSVLAGILLPTSGQVEILGMQLDDPRMLGKIGVLMQDAAFRTGIQGMEQVLFMARLGGMDDTTARSEVMAALEELGDAAFADLNPETMSFGQRKRLAMAQALLGTPAIVLLDEPTAGLDPLAAHAVRQLIRRKSADILFLVSSHNLYEIQDICTRVLVIDQGRLTDDVDITGLGRENNRFSLMLDRAATAELVSALREIAEISDVILDNNLPERVQLHIAAADIDRLQLQVQSLLNSRGYSVTGFTRGRTLADGVLDLGGSPE